MNTRNQSGSAHVVIIIILVVALLGTLGFVFWQNFLAPKDDKVTEQVTTQETTEAEITPEVDKIAASKSEIAASMNNNYKGLSAHMISPIGGSIANSDGIFRDKTSDELVALIQDYFGTSNPDLAVSTSWTFVDYKNLTNDKLTNQFKQSGFPDYATSYIGTAKIKDGSDVFVAYTLNEDGLITYAFWGLVSGF